MDKNSYIGLGLIALVLIVFGILSQPSKEELEAMKKRQDSLAAVERAKIEKAKIEQAKKDSIAKSDTAKVKVQNDSLKTVEKFNKYGIFTQASTGKEKLIIMQNEYLKLILSSKGGRPKAVYLNEYKTYDQKPLQIFGGDSSTFSLIFQVSKENDKLHYTTVSTEKLFFEPLSNVDSLNTASADSVSMTFRLFADSTQSRKKYIDFTYTLRKNSYLVGFSINMQGFGEQIMSREFIDFVWKSNVISKEKSIQNERSNTTIYFKYFSDEGVDYLSETSDDRKKLDTKVKWIGFKEQFFTSVWIANSGFVNAEISTHGHHESYTNVKTLTANIGIPYNPAKSEPFTGNFYFGPNKYKILSAFDLELEKQIPIGWGFFLMAWVNRFIVIPVFNLLEGTGLNYGIIILILTIFIKILLFPIAYKTYISSAKMKLLKPDIDEINKKFNNAQKDDALKKQQEIMNLYKKAGVNPLSGCVPMLLQFPILIAMFRFFPSAIELRQQAFLWADDLSSYDSILDLGFTIPMYGDHVSLFTLLMTISTLIYTKMNMGMMSDNQMPAMKWMMYLMPIMFLGIFNNFSSGLSYYYFLTNIITFLQQWIIKKFIVNEDKLRRQIQENKAKNVVVKKSKWQQKIEEMAKKQQNMKRR